MGHDKDRETFSTGQTKGSETNVVGVICVEVIGLLVSSSGACDPTKTWTASLLPCLLLVLFEHAEAIRGNRVPKQ